MNHPREALASDVPQSDRSDSTSPEPAAYPPDPSAKSLERKAQMRAAASARQIDEQRHGGEVGRGFFRGDTSSGAFRPLNYGSNK